MTTTTTTTTSSHLLLITNPLRSTSTDVAVVVRLVYVVALVLSQILFLVTCGTLASATAVKWTDRSQVKGKLSYQQLRK